MRFRPPRRSLSFCSTWWYVRLTRDLAKSAEESARVAREEAEGARRNDAEALEALCVTLMVRLEEIEGHTALANLREASGWFEWELERLNRLAPAVPGGPMRAAFATQRLLWLSRRLAYAHDPSADRSYLPSGEHKRFATEITEAKGFLDEICVKARARLSPPKGVAPARAEPDSEVARAITAGGERKA